MIITPLVELSFMTALAEYPVQKNHHFYKAGLLQQIFAVSLNAAELVYVIPEAFLVFRREGDLMMAAPVPVGEAVVEVSGLST